MQRGMGEAWLVKIDYTSGPRWKGWVPVFEQALRGKDADVLWRAGEFGVLEPASGRIGAFASRLENIT